MAKSNIIKFRVSSEQKDRIKKEAIEKGYCNISHYLRDMALKRNLAIELKIIETNIMTKKLLELHDSR